MLIPVRCPHCQSDQVIKGGTAKVSTQRYRCHNADCSHYSFVRNPAYQAHRPEVKAQIIDIALNGSGIRDTARVLKISADKLNKRTFVAPRQRWVHRWGWRARCGPHAAGRCRAKVQG